MVFEDKIYSSFGKLSTNGILKENSAMLAFKRAEEAFSGEAAKAGFETEEEIQNYIQEIRKEGKLSSRIGLKNDIEISLLLRDRDTFERGGNVFPFYKNIKKDGIEIYG